MLKIKNLILNFFLLISRILLNFIFNNIYQNSKIIKIKRTIYLP